MMHFFRTLILIAAIVSSLNSHAGEWFTTPSGCQVWNDLPNPDEVVTWSGGCENGKASGEGNLVWTYFDADGNSISSYYQGPMLGGNEHGKGAYFWADGDRYQGEFVNGSPHGYGTYYFSNGDRYNGQWENGSHHGQGTYYHNDGSRHQGNFKNGSRHGQGIFYDSDDSQKEGIFQNNIIWKGWVYFPGGKSCEVDNGQFVVTGCFSSQ